MYLSTSPTCSLCDVSFKAIPMSASLPRRCPNLPSIKAATTLNPFRRYTCRMAFTLLIIMADLLFGIASIIPNLILCDMETNIATQLTYMISTHIVTSWYLFSMLTGTNVIGESNNGQIPPRRFTFQ